MLRGLLDGTREPTDASMAIDLARVGRARGRHLASAMAWSKAFELRPGVPPGLRAEAARSAVLAGHVEGDLARKDAAAAARWRGRALEWLRGEIGDVRDAALTARDPLRAELLRWRTTEDYRTVREEAELARLETEEREAWTALWRTVERLIGPEKGP
jgi:hypothetical protein